MSQNTTSEACREEELCSVRYLDLFEYFSVFIGPRDRVGCPLMCYFIELVRNDSRYSGNKNRGFTVGPVQVILRMTNFRYEYGLKFRAHAGAVGVVMYQHMCSTVHVFF